MPRSSEKEVAKLCGRKGRSSIWKIIEFTRLIGLRMERPVEQISFSGDATRHVVDLMPSNLGPVKDTASAALQGFQTDEDNVPRPFIDFPRSFDSHTSTGHAQAQAHAHAHAHAAGRVLAKRRKYIAQLLLCLMEPPFQE